MDKSEQKIVEATASFIKEKFEGESSGHDWWHMYRVWKLSQTIALGEKANPFIVELGALLHDVADWKFHDGDFEAGPKVARKWLESQGVNHRTIQQIEEIIRTVSFKGAGVGSNMKTMEGKIVHDADKLDAIGALGIARTFAYGGSTNMKMHDPLLKPVLHQTFEEYKNMDGTSINHFYEKLLLLKDLLYTNKAKQLAGQRHAFMEQYLEEFYAEWDGKR